MERAFFVANQVGTIFMVADERGNEVKRIINDSFGNLLLDSGVSLDICLGFAAGLTDKDTELIHLGYREYDPAIGRFITPDPLGFAGGDVDVYGYCLDDPINFHDRTGLEGKSEEGHLVEKNVVNKHETIQKDKNITHGHSFNSPNSKVFEKEERAKAIQDAVSPSLKGIAKAYLDTPDDRFSLILPYLKQVNKEIKSDKANK